jgi:hypothetical protein
MRLIEDRYVESNLIELFKVSGYLLVVHDKNLGRWNQHELNDLRLASHHGNSE